MKVYVPLYLSSWEGLGLQADLNGVRVKVVAPEWSPGVLVAYRTMEDALEAHPGIEMRHVMIMNVPVESDASGGSDGE